MVTSLAMDQDLYNKKIARSAISSHLESKSLFRYLDFFLSKS